MEFRGRGDEIHVWPLSFKEFMTAYDGPKEDGWARLQALSGSCKGSVRIYILKKNSEILLRDRRNLE